MKKRQKWLKREHIFTAASQEFRVKNFFRPNLETLQTKTNMAHLVLVVIGRYGIETGPTKGHAMLRR